MIHHPLIYVILPSKVLDVFIEGSSRSVFPENLLIHTVTDHGNGTLTFTVIVVKDDNPGHKQHIP